VIACFGDSLTAGYGIAPGQSYPQVLQRDLDNRGYRYRVVNLGESGNTTVDGIRRMQEALAVHPSVVVLEFGVNDALRGLPADAAKANLARLIESFQAAGAQVILGGMILPASLAPGYLPKFNAMYRDVESKYGVTLIPFFLEGVAGRAELMQNDGMHPNAKGAGVVAGTVFRALEPILKK
jgi:acyl-CoA thioesterase-1